jgi:hypothetical protein
VLAKRQPFETTIHVTGGVVTDIQLFGFQGRRLSAWRPPRESRCPIQSGRRMLEQLSDIPSYVTALTGAAVGSRYSEVGTTLP